MNLTTIRYVRGTIIDIPKFLGNQPVSKSHGFERNRALY
jgi:hypothetical protein